MPDWLIPVIVAAGGGTGIGALFTAIVNAKSAANAQLHALIDQYQEDRKADREAAVANAAEVRRALERYDIEREHSTDLHAWALAGAPPPPPVRRQPTQ